MKKKNLLKTIIGATSTLLLSGNIYAQAGGDLDLTFGASGYTTTDHLVNTGEVFQDMITLADNKIIMIGYTDVANQNVLLTKYDENGIVDATFGNNGYVELDLSLGANDEGFVVRELPDSKLLIAGISVGQTSWDAFVMRLNADGSTDISFGQSGNGKTLFNAGANTVALANEIFVNADNSFFVGATVLNANSDADFAVFKFMETGVLNLSFGSGGSMLYDNAGANDQLNSMFVNANGNIILAGNTDDGTQKGLIVRTSPFGTLDAAFGTGGMLVYDGGMAEHYFNDVIETSANKIVVVGSEGTAPGYKGMILQYLSTGAPDNSFGTNGKQTSDVGGSNGIYLYKVTEYQGRILTTGNAFGASMQDIYAFMMTDTGSPVSEFSSGDVYHTPPTSVASIGSRCLALQSDGKILIGGDLTGPDFIGNNTIIARLFNIDIAGIHAIDADEAKISVYPNPVSTAFAIDAAQEIVFVQLIDQQGKVVNSWDGSQSEYEIGNEVNNGTYFVRIVTEGSIRQTKLQIVK